MNPEEFVQRYEQALATQDWRSVDPLIHADACITFSNGTVHRGKLEVRKAFERNFSLIEDEAYAISNVQWVIRGPDLAVYLFDFSWSGHVNGKQARGAGRGTSVVIKDGDRWQLLVEHLGPKAE